ncbi:MAG: ATP-binding protein [Gammaproteobacteria bacterium]|nr:ATP-binding protein [Gammaproteobacteria bacterium]
MIEWLLDNLSDNAICYSHKNSEITISITESGQGRLSMAVKDLGRGIPEDQKHWYLNDFIRLIHLNENMDMQGLAYVS